MNINIEDFSLTNFISSVETIPFDYAGVEGIADCLGHYIICFKEKNSDILSAIDENLFTDRKIWYYYINEGKGLLSIGINLADKVMSLEIITHPTIIKERKETLSIS